MHRDLKILSLLNEVAANFGICIWFCKLNRVADQSVAYLSDPRLVSDDCEGNILELFKNKFDTPLLCVIEVCADYIVHQIMDTEFNITFLEAPFLCNTHAVIQIMHALDDETGATQDYS